MRDFEILAPVGAQEQLYAAVRCGADAVYLGAGDFNARRNAENFSDADLKSAIDYCHLRNVKAYITLNTLVFDKEMDRLYDTITAIAQSGADAVIVQDFAVAQAVKEICPELPLHASTQMAIHNVSGAKQLEELGFSRIVLARELSLKEIEAIRGEVNVELEVFVHGAHCMGASGNCYLSAMLGERSGNRGLCAQGCRLNWVSQHGREYALSLKDMSYLDNINDLKNIGIESFKIEGRMKRPEYVAAAVTSLNKALSGEQYDKSTLRSVFSRNGFTDGYLKGKRDISMFGYRGKEDVTSATGVLKELASLYKNDIHPIEIDVFLSLKKDAPSTLTMQAYGESIKVTGDIAEEPRNAPLSEEIAKRNASKLGDTPFSLNSFSFENPHNLTLSASSINAMRREACQLLSQSLLKTQREINPVNEYYVPPYRPSKATQIRIRLEKISMLSADIACVQFIILPIEEILKNKDRVHKIKSRVMAELPQLIYPAKEAEIKNMLAEIKAMGINHTACGNIGAFKLCKDMDFTVHGTHALNITNTKSLEFYEKIGLEDATLSFELSEKQIKAIGGSLKRGAYVYGYLPLMHMRACPQKTEAGCGKCDGFTHLTDRKSVRFPLICHNKEYTTLHNSVPLYIGDKNLSYFDFVTLYFTTESAEECSEILQKFIVKKNINMQKTNGLFSRELL